MYNNVLHYDIFIHVYSIYNHIHHSLLCLGPLPYSLVQSLLPN